MIDIIPSKQMKAYFESIGFKLNDFHKATLIWNAPNYTRKEILDSLKELAEQTADALIRKQISERLLYEEKEMEHFLDNALGEYVYVVEDREDGCSCGFFASYEMAAAYALKYMARYDTRCHIEKQFIMKKIVGDEYSGKATSGVELDSKARIINFWTSDEIVGLGDLFSKGRFENSFVVVPFHLEAGMIVQNVVNRKYYLLACGKEQWMNYLQEMEKRKEMIDFSDVQVMVYEVNDDGAWRHCHINPILLKEVTQSDSEYFELKRRYRKLSEDIRYQMKL